ncbi:hypothetical protein BST61_g9973 [Cercospora zeina]
MNHTPRYFTVDQPDDRSLSVNGTPRECSSLYVAIAKAHTGNYQAASSIKSAVLHFAHRAHAQKDHAFHKDYMQRESYYRMNEHLSLYSGLECPDFSPNHDLFWIIAFALNIRLRVFFDISDEGVGGKFYEAGPPHGRLVVVLQRWRSGPRRSIFAALLPDKSGRELVEYLFDVQQLCNSTDASAIRIERVNWLVRYKAQGHAVTCVNRFRAGSPLHDFGVIGCLSRLDTFQMVVHDPKQISAALCVMQGALSRHPARQRRVRVRNDCAPGALLPYVSADLEMVKMPRLATVGKAAHEIQQMVDRLEIEPLVSVLTISVGGRLVIHFNILNMMERPTHDTVPALRELFEELIFNPQRLLIWWNLQNDVTAMDNTIAHLYQGTAREPFHSRPYGAKKQIWVTPQFHLRSHYFLGARPESLMFPTKPTPMVALWRRSRGDPLAPLLRDLKHAVERSGRPAHDFYQSLGQRGMEMDDNVVGYLSGDAQVPGRIFELIFASNDAEFIAGRLRAWELAPYQDPAKIPRSVPQNRAVRYVQDIPLFEDDLALPEFHSGPRFADYSWVHNLFISDAIFVRSEFLEPWEHDRNVNIMRRRLDRGGGPVELLQKPYYELPSEEDVEKLESRRQVFLRDMTDTGKFWLPTSCARLFLEGIYRPIMRTNQTSAESLLEYLQLLDSTAQASPPPGFAAAPGSCFGLPSVLNITPGADLVAAREILDAYRGVHHIKPWFMPAHNSQLMRMKSTLPPDRFDFKAFAATVEERLRSLPTHERQATLDGLRNSLMLRVQQEEQLNIVEGRPSFIDMYDLLDPEGRAFRSRVARTKPWNQPMLLFKPIEWTNGAWASLAKFELDALKWL